MKSLTIFAAAAAAMLPGIAAAQSNTPITGARYPDLGPGGSLSEIYIRPYGCPPMGPGNNLAGCGEAYFVGLGQFARDEDLAILAAGFAEELDRAAEHADDGAAMAGAMDFVAPADGATNRIGAQAFTMGDRGAIGVTYTRAAGRFDFGVGVAASENRTAGKVGIGLSW